MLGAVAGGKGPISDVQKGGAGPGPWALYIDVQCIMSNGHMGLCKQTDRHEWKHCLPATSLAGGKNNWTTENLSNCFDWTCHNLNRNYTKYCKPIWTRLLWEKYGQQSTLNQETKTSFHGAFTCGWFSLMISRKLQLFLPLRIKCYKQSRLGTSKFLTISLLITEVLKSKCMFLG